VSLNAFPLFDKVVDVKDGAPGVVLKEVRKQKLRLRIRITQASNDDDDAEGRSTRDRTTKQSEGNCAKRRGGRNRRE
jgi:hypothetical protein